MAEYGRNMKLIRPDWNTLISKMTDGGGAIVLCSCQSMLNSVQALRAHYDQGHFDSQAKSTDVIDSIFYQALMEYFEEIKQTNWGKNQIITAIKDIYICCLEEVRKQNESN